MIYFTQESMKQVSITVRAWYRRMAKPKHNKRSHTVVICSGVPRNFVWRGGWGGSTNSVEARENGDLGVVAP